MKPPLRNRSLAVSYPCGRLSPYVNKNTPAGFARVLHRAKGDSPLAPEILARAKTAREKLTDYAVKHARSQLRAAGIRRPADREALLATHLDGQSTAEPEPRLCACGCGHPIPAESRRGRAQKYLNETHPQASAAPRAAAHPLAR